MIQIIMKILYVADNRNRMNIGCRATSIALNQLLSEKNEITGVISGKYTNGGNIIYSAFFSGILCFCIKKIKFQELYANIWWHGINRLFSKKIVNRWFHWVSYNPEKSILELKKCIINNPWLSELNLENYDFDVMVINGEGSMIMSTPYRIDTLVYLMFCWWAKHMNKRVYLVNAMFSDCPKTGRNLKTVSYANKVLKNIELITTRDYESTKYVKSILKDCKVVFCPDALFTWNKYVMNGEPLCPSRYILPFGNETEDIFEKLDFSIPYICLSGSSNILPGDKYAIRQYVDLVNTLRKKLNVNVIIVQACRGDDFLIEVGKLTHLPCILGNTAILSLAKILQNADVYISGRYHPSILASLNGTPCIMMNSNSHKTLSLQEMLDYTNCHEFNSIPSKEEISQIAQLAEDYIDNRSFIREKIIKRTEELAELAKELITLIR